MLNSISWSDYFLMLLILVGSYYAVTVLLLYRTEIKNFLKGDYHSNVSDDETTEVAADVLGTTRSIVGPKIDKDNTGHESRIVINHNHSSEIDTLNQHSDEELLTGSVSDLLEEVKTKIKSLKGWSKDECLPVIRESLSDYRQLKGTVYQESINFFIANTCAENFDWLLEPEEVRPLWP